MISFSFSEILDLRSRCWHGNLTEVELDRLAELCSFAFKRVVMCVDCFEYDSFVRVIRSIFGEKAIIEFIVV